MSHQAETNSSDTIRAILFKEGDVYVAQCLEFDICAQGPDIPSLLARLDLTVEAEFETCRRLGRLPSDVISPAPSRFHDLWTRRAIELRRKEPQANRSADRGGFGGLIYAVSIRWPSDACALR